MSAVMTIIDIASMIVWLSARPSSRRASGMRTLDSICRPVAPIDCPASTVLTGTRRMPSAVMRMAAGMA